MTSVTNYPNVLDTAPGSRTLLDDYFVEEQALGEGGFGKVYRAVCKRTGQLFACKSIHKSRFSNPEYDILTHLTGHANIVGLVDAYEDPLYVHFILELCRGGELFDRIISSGKFSEAEAAHFFRHMVEAIHHCHVHGVIHRDIKPENFLLTSSDDDAQLKACDFGLSVFFKHGEWFKEEVGSDYYIAPEVLRRHYNQACDLWALGVVLYILLSGTPPFWGATRSEIRGRVAMGRLDLESHPWPSISLEAKDIIRSLLRMDPAARASTQQLLQHPWLVKQGVAPDRPLDPLVITRMKQFAKMTRLKKVAIVAAAKHLQQHQIEGLRNMFQDFDTNGDGVIELSELRDGLLYTLGTSFTEQELLQMMIDTDVDRSGFIEYEEFLAATVNLNLLWREEVLINTFRELDKDGNGTLSADEIAEAVKPMGSLSGREVAELIAVHDKNKDGCIDYREFIAMLREHDGSELKRAASNLRAQGWAI